MNVPKPPDMDDPMLMSKVAQPALRVFLQAVPAAMRPVLGLLTCLTCAALFEATAFFFLSSPSLKIAEDTTISFQGLDLRLNMMS